ncbi:M1 family metallopeptidase [Sphingomonas piscis]|uniref:Aminopeptidase n=2 Tax=Sphingomonas piscis TaxID=2714943 RepID=A0A6G7YT46_9SPHN|nr:M1 family metallopeptidase [Sphingomonas piscis]
MNVRPLLALSVAAAALLAAPQQSAAAPDTVDASLPTQLPREAVPSHYAITVTPNAPKLTFDANVLIDLQVVKPTRSLTLNAADLSFRKVSISGAAQATGRAKTNADAQTATFDFGRTLAPGKYRLAVDYSGKINTQANGLFALDYKNKEGKDARSLFTQFEAPDARRFVPSWDEPDYKATFDLTARVPAAETAVSNMPVATSRTIAGGLKEYRFQTSPVMSSYLLFFAQGDFERIAKKVGDREVGIVVSRGNGDKARYALDAEAQLLPYFDDYFGVPYPLPKLDNVAGPGQSQFFGAMENWGAIFTFEKILLNDPAITTERDRQAIFSVEAHEMAHQWFGNLVTMAWWDDLWLNEGFASWMATRATQHFHPDWGADVDRVASREEAMALDAIKSTHPIVQQIRTVEQANQAFDNITYEKGQSVITMLEGFAGADIWQAGIQAYMKRHAYQNTRTADLWAAVEGAGAKGLTQVANDFTNQPGIPLITVGPARCVGGRTVATLTQTQFAGDDRARVSTPLRWHVPVRASAGGKVAQIITAGPTNTIEVEGCGPLLINPGQTGYFRTLYQPQQAAALIGRFGALGPVDQFGLMTEQLVLSSAGYQPMSVGLDAIAAVPATGNAKVVNEAVSRWNDLYDELEGQPALQQAIASRMVRTYGPRLQQLGFAPRAGESPIETLLRPTLIGRLGKYGDPAVKAEGKRLFTAWQSNPDAIPGSLKGSWLGVVADNADAATWDALHRSAQRASGAVERSTLYELLGRARNEALARRALELALTDEPGKTVSASIIRSVAAVHPKMAIEFVLAHLAQVNELVDISGRSRFMQRLVGDSSDASLIPILESYANANLAATDRAPINQAIDTIRLLSARQSRMRSEVGAWLAGRSS